MTAENETSLSRNSKGSDSGITNSGFEGSENENMSTLGSSGEISFQRKREKKGVKESDDIVTWYPIVKESDKLEEENEETEKKREKLLQYIDENVIGKDAEFLTPYGRRKCKIT